MTSSQPWTYQMMMNCSRCSKDNCSLHPTRLNGCSQLIWTHLTSDGTGVRLPKPTFDGSLIHWKQFWDQFAVSVHNKKNISNAVYLQHAIIKDGDAKNAIEGFGDKAVECSSPAMTDLV